MTGACMAAKFVERCTNETRFRKPKKRTRPVQHLSYDEKVRRGVYRGRYLAKVKVAPVVASIFISLIFFGMCAWEVGMRQGHLPRPDEVLTSLLGE